jgi:hypothetical protein
MAYCDNEKKNVGVGKCVDLPKIIRSFITTPKNWSVTMANALLQATWQDAIIAPVQNRIYRFPYFSDIPEYAGSETTYLRNAVGVSPVTDGKYEWLCKFAKNACFHKAAFSHRATEGRIILIDADGYFYGTKVGNNFAGFTLEMLHTENLMFNDGSRPSETPVRIALANPNEINHSDYGIIRVAPSWSIDALNILTDVELTIISASATQIVVDVKQACDGTPVNGLDDVDFILLNGAGAAQTITSASEVDGRYTLAGSGLVSGTLDLEAPDDLSIQAYENPEPVEVTVV